MSKDRKANLLLQGCAILLCLLALSVSAAAQRKTTKKPVPKATPKPAASLVVREESTKVAAQIKDITKFLYFLGGTNQLIIGIDTDPKATANAKNQSNIGKQGVIKAIKNVRAGLVQLEGEFHSKPELRPYIIHIQGVSEMAGIAEGQAAGGQLDNAGKTLLEVVNRLTETLKNLR